MLKRITLTFDIDKKDEKEAYDRLKSQGRSMSRFISNILLNKGSETLYIDTDLIADKIAEKLRQSNIRPVETKNVSNDNIQIDHEDISSSDEGEEIPETEESVSMPKDIDTDLMLGGLEAFTA